MSADDFFGEGNEAFVDDDYSLAVQKYTAAIELNSHTVDPKYYIKRAAAFIKMKQYQDAITDASSAITLDPNNGKAFLRKGIALYHQSKFNLAKDALDKALDLDGSQEAKKWLEKCNDQLNQASSVGTVAKDPKCGEGTTDAPKTTQQSEPAVAKMVTKPRYDWYQTDARVVITFLVKNRTLDDVKCDIEENSLSVCVKLEDGSDYTLSFDLAHAIVASQSKFKVMTSKLFMSAFVGIKAAKKINNPPYTITKEESAVSTHMYPTSSHTHRNWDKVAADIEKEEKEEKLEGDAALNALFQKIYGEGSDEVKRAMNKSFVESGGTVLSTNWDEVGKKKVDCKPPDGMEHKQY